MEKTEFNDKIKTETKWMCILLAVMIVLFQIIFYKGEIIKTVRTVISIFWIFVLPGFYLMYLWLGKLKFFERVTIGTALNIALVGIAGYYLGIIGVHTKYHMIILPAAILTIAYCMIKRKIRKIGQQ